MTARPVPRTLTALLLSFLVYLTPILHAHGGTLLGIYLWAALVDGRDGRDALWLATDAGLAVALQAAWFAAFRWMLAGARLRWLLLLALAPVTVAAIVWAYLVAIPTQFLIEADNARETGNWPVACSVPDASTVGLPTGVTLALERAGETWLRTGPGAVYGVLSMPGCAVTRRELFFPGARGGIGYVTAGGAVWYRLDPDGSGAFQHRLSTSASPDPVTLQQPPGIDYWLPILDARAEAMAWIESRRGDNRAIIGHSIAVHVLRDSRTFRIALPLGPYSSPRLLDFDHRAGRSLSSAITARS